VSRTQSSIIADISLCRQAFIGDYLLFDAAKASKFKTFLRFRQALNTEITYLLKLLFLLNIALLYI
jgi:hypothetical protein